MDLLKSVTLGVVQGLTEFLPVSSSAHLEIVPRLLHWEDIGTQGTAIIQLGTLLAVVVYFWKDLVSLTVGFVRSSGKKDEKSIADARLGWSMIVGTVPIIIGALVLKKFIENEFRNLWVVATMFIVMALLLWLSEIVAKHKRGIETATLKDAFLIGIGQTISLIPGSSRSGSTLTAALFLGFTREAAARFSFLLSVPAVLISGLYELYDWYKHRTDAPLPNTMVWTTTDLVVATVVSFVVGYLSIAFLLKFLRTNSTLIFVIYRIAVGLLLFYLLWSNRISATIYQ